MTDEELIAHLRLQGLDKDIAAADRIEELVKERDVSNELGKALEKDAGQLRAKLAKAYDIIARIVAIAPDGDEYDDEWHMTYDAAKNFLDELEKTE